MHYHEETENKIRQKVKDLLDDMPESVNDFIISIAGKAPKTLLNYIYDIRMFYNYCIKNIAFLQEVKIKDIDNTHINNITAKHIEQFLFTITTSKSMAGRNRKLSALKSYFKYMFKHEYIKKNVCDLVSFEEIKDKPITFLDYNEVVNLLEEVEKGDFLTEKEKEYFNLIKTRNVCIFSLFLMTGCRLNEIAGLSINDIDFNKEIMYVQRKGGKTEEIALSEDAKKILKEYLQERKMIIPLSGHEDALFLSIQKRRLSTRAIQNLIVKYSQKVVPHKHITPHKLRSTVGTLLYREIHDLYRISSILGHSTVETSKKYAQVDKYFERKALNLLKFKDDGTGK